MNSKQKCNDIDPTTSKLIENIFDIHVPEIQKLTLILESRNLILDSI